eukprot:6438376-Pyramimonas_sp.AAC.1
MLAGRPAARVGSWPGSSPGRPPLGCRMRSAPWPWRGPPWRNALGMSLIDNWGGHPNFADNNKITWIPGRCAAGASVLTAPRLRVGIVAPAPRRAAL